MKGALGVFLALAIWPTAAVAQAAGESKTAAVETGSAHSPTEAEQARDLGRAGLNAYGQSDFERALDLFQRADALAHSPVFRLYVARALVGLGKISESRTEYEAILATTPSEGAPDAWLRARRAAADELAALPLADAKKMASDSADFDADGHVVRVVNGEPIMPSWHPEPPPKRSFWLRATPNERGAFVAFGIGTVGLVFAAVTGGLAIAESSAVKANCIDGVCPAQDLPRAQQAVQLADLATVGVSVAVAGGATGLVLWLLPEGRHGETIAVSVAGPSLRVVGRF